MASCQRAFLLCVFYVINLMQDAVAKNNTESYRILELHTKTKWNRERINYLKHKYQMESLSSESPHKASWEFLVKPEVLSSVALDLDTFRIPYQLHQTSDHMLFKNDFEMRGSRRKRASTQQQENLRHRFLTYEEIGNLLKTIHIQTRSQPTVNMVVGSIGQSFEGRDTPYVLISNQTKGEKKPVIFIDAGIHSREWISPAMAMEIIYQLTLNPDNDPEVHQLLSMFDWVIVPLVNPDGYVFTFSDAIFNRLWRKSRTASYSDNPECFGVDLNRNFGFQWNDDPIFGGSNNPCSMIYSGPHSFSEPETRNLRDLLLAHGSSIQVYLSFHSFGQFFLYPWGFSSQVDLDGETDLHHVASAFADTMEKRNYNYHVGGTAKLLYPAAGGSNDYVRGSLGVKYVYTIELPPHSTSRHGFLLPESDVKSVVTDTWDGLKSMVFRLRGKLTNAAGGKNNTARGWN